MCIACLSYDMSRHYIRYNMIDIHMPNIRMFNIYMHILHSSYSLHHPADGAAGRADRRERAQAAVSAGPLQTAVAGMIRM